MLYVFARGIFRLIFRFVYRWKIMGLHNVPTQGPAILCSNHISLWDPPAVGSPIERKIVFFAKDELFRPPVLGWIIRGLQAIPVKRGQGDRTAIKTALQVLADQKILGIFPEGTRSKTGEVSQAQTGVALFALKSGAPVIPAAIIGPYRMFRPIHILYGPPVDLSEFQDQKTTSAVLEQVSQKIMNAIAELIESHR